VDQSDRDEPQRVVPRRRRAAWKAWAGFVFVVALFAGGGFYFSRQQELRARLLRVDADGIAQDPDLLSFAISYARPVYEHNCAGCHGDRMQGDPGYGVPGLGNRDWLYGEGRANEIERTILFGIRASNGRTLSFADMPAYARAEPYKRYKIEPLGPQEIADVVTFLVVAGGRAGDADAARRGAQIFSDKGQCFDCHASDAKGDAAIGAPNLLGNTWLHGNGSFQDIYNVVAEGSSGICPAWFQRLSAVDIRALTLLVFSASHPEPPRAASRSSEPPG
jgi:cytochrome c oxidase cbb3-type subunit III